MTSTEHRYFWPDQAKHCTVSILENVQIAKDTFRVRFSCPKIAATITPGQFLMLRIAGSADPLLGRPLALYDVIANQSGNPTSIDVIYLRMGKLTTLLSQCRTGRELEVWGPLGNGFEPRSTKHLYMVAGGIGQTPFLALAKEALGKATYATNRTSGWAEKVTFCYGARNADYFADLQAFAKIGVEVLTSTDDGTAGLHGRVTDLLAPRMIECEPESTRVVCCGPEPMMKAVAELTRTARVACEVSLETPMACGLGICFSCVAKLRTSGDEWDYRRTCVEGPVFDAQDIMFD